MSPRYNQDWEFEHGYEDASDIYGITPKQGYTNFDLLFSPRHEPPPDIREITLEILKNKKRLSDYQLLG